MADFPVVRTWGNSIRRTKKKVALQALLRRYGQGSSTPSPTELANTICAHWPPLVRAVTLPERGLEDIDLAL
ncbi:hypothetical protein M514_03796 [Trichuris suis]|uniref:Uncharacterized protein n=1 Tax=Trichuris suis TaxID=68888 RepID=A0A085ME10_9BILA|nr:hypothetical protein M513_03796 [Trichuris suis]KFD62686.1 hypothetical protein M514_03796 [Trichuris suis]